MRATRILLKGGGGNSKIIFSLENASFEQRAEQTGVTVFACITDGRGHGSLEEKPPATGQFLWFYNKKKSPFSAIWFKLHNFLLETMKKN